MAAKDTGHEVEQDEEAALGYCHLGADVHHNSVQILVYKVN